MIDLHSHILPGIDDGAGSINSSLRMAAAAVKAGITKMVATPHIFRENISTKDIENISDIRENFIKTLAQQKIPLQIFSGVEVHISHDLMGEIKKNRDSLVINGGSYILLEFPYDHVYSGVKELFFDLMSEGLFPVIAHPERNLTFKKNPRLLYELVSMGGYSQANSSSFLGLYGENVRDAALTYLKLGLVHFLGSDCHNSRMTLPHYSSAVKRIAGEIGAEGAEKLVKDNPQSVLDDAQIPFRPEPKDPQDTKRTLKLKIPKIFMQK